MSCKASFFLPPTCRYNMGDRHNAKAKVQILCETRKYLWNYLLFSVIYRDSTKKKVEKSLEYYRKLLIFAASRSNSWLSGQNPERARLNRHYPFWKEPPRGALFYFRYRFMRSGRREMRGVLRGGFPWKFLTWDFFTGRPPRKKSHVRFFHAALTFFSRVRVPSYFIRRGLKFVASVFAVSLFLLNFAGRTNNCDY